jgi:hypothetical protein
MHLRTLIIAMLLCASTVGAQRPDTVAAARPDSLRPPLGPRRAFFYSFLLPGYSQSVLGRHKAAAGFMLFEAIAIGMLRESAADVHQARRMERDTLVLSWVDASGNPLFLPDTISPRYTSREVHTRLAHLEDWTAILIANHLFAGADAFVAANLWDVGMRLGLRALPQGRTALTASFRW